MRIMVGIMACIGFGGGTLAIADPAPGTAPAATSAQAAAPAAPAVPAASQATGTQPPSAAQSAAATAPAGAPSGADEEAAAEKRLRSAGYKPEMQNGTKVWCRAETAMGSRLSAQKSCGSVKDLALAMQENQRNLSDTQRKIGSYPKSN